MFRPMMVAPMLLSNSSKTGVLWSTAPPSSPCGARHAASPTAHSCSPSPPIPSGVSTLWPGPEVYPSREIEILKRNLDIFQFHHGAKEGGALQFRACRSDHNSRYGLTDARF